MTGNSKADKNRYCIIHGHFYQPSRENPWTNSIDRQPSAAPYHDWNERIYAECYRPNGYSRILDQYGRIKDITNNYNHLSFNIGPTLFVWFEERYPAIVQRILDADAQSAERLNGHGNAIAQVYNHIIMPLASRKDQRTQVRWAKSFFKSRFGREAEGLWLAETALNMETVSVLIDEGISFIILSPTQAEAVCSLTKENEWADVSNNAIDTKAPYRLYEYTVKGRRLERFIDVFFFDEGLSRAASFDNLLINADTLSDRVISAYQSSNPSNQCVFIATDGETFGHHKPFTDMCLAYFFNHTASQRNIEVVNCGYYRSINPPVMEVRLKNMWDEGTSWSCAHGTGRWIRDCGCRTGGHEHWNQRWRTPLRDALNILQHDINCHYETTLRHFTADPWLVRDAYEPFTAYESADSFFSALTVKGVTITANYEELDLVRKLCEAQKYMLLSFSSCGWFFADVSDITTIQNLLFASRAIQLGLPASKTDKSVAHFLEILNAAKSNIIANTGPTTGKSLYVSHTAVHRHNLELCSFTAAAEALFFDSEREHLTYGSYSVDIRSILQNTLQKTSSAVYVTQICNTRTNENGLFSVLLVHEEKNILRAHIVPFDVTKNVHFNMGVIEEWKRTPALFTATLSDLYQDLKVRLQKLYQNVMTNDISQSFSAWYVRHKKTLDSLTDLCEGLPHHLKGPMSFLLNNLWNEEMHRLVENLSIEEKVFKKLREIFDRFRRFAIAIDFSQSVQILQGLLESEMQVFGRTLSLKSCDTIRYLLNIVDRFSIPIAKGTLEDQFYLIFNTTIKDLYEQYMNAEQPDPEKKVLLLKLLSFARRMNFSTERFPVKNLK